MPTLEASPMTTPVETYYNTDAVRLTRLERFSGARIIYNTWVVAPANRIVRLERLPMDWDGHGSPPPDEATGNLATVFLNQIAQLGFEELPPPHIGPIAGGGIILEWNSPPHELSFSVFNEGVIAYLKSRSGEPFDEEAVTPWETGRLRELVSWLLSPVAAGGAST